MNICLVGYGSIAEEHMKAFDNIRGINPYMLVGRRLENTHNFARKWDFKKHTIIFEDAVNDPEVDAVIITSPNALHAEQATKALLAGKHVLLEIPMALSLSDAERIVDVAKNSGKNLMIAHTMRYCLAIQEVRKRVELKTLKIKQMVGFMGLPRRENVTSNGKARSWADNILWHFGAHMVDIALWVSGYREVKNLSCQCGPEYPGQGFLDMSLTMKLPGDEIFALSQSFNINEFRWQMTFIGEEATLDFDMGALYDTQGGLIIPKHSVTDLFEQDREFIESIRENRDPAITADEVMPAMKILDQAESMLLSVVS